MKSQLIGSAIGLALCIVLPACSQGASSETRNASADGSGITLNSKFERQIRDAIARAPTHGLKPDSFLKGGETGEQLVQSALKYANALANGYSDPKKLFEVYTIPRPHTDVRAGLRQALRNGNVGKWLDSLAPQTDEYKALGAAFERYLKLAGDQKDETLDTGDVIKPGARDSRIPKIAAFLRVGGYLGNGQSQPQTQGERPRVQNPSGQDGSADNLYSPQLVAAVKAYQSDSGLKSDGILGGNTLEALNNGAVDRARQLAVAMERLRWLQRDPPKTRIDVNIAATTLDYYRDGQHVGQRKVVAGEPDKTTPQLQSPLYRLVAKPTWTVPKGIGEKELADKSQAWLEKNNFKMEDGRYVQQSGPKNSLGLVKLDLKNDQAIYLHDTPAKALFSVDNRHRSHGCVRVENAVEFARMIARQEGVADQFDKAMSQDDQTFVELPSEIPVRLLYRTAFWDGARVRYRKDYYNWDQNVAKALGLAPGRPEKIEQPESSDDIGP